MASPCASIPIGLARARFDELNGSIVRFHTRNESGRPISQVFR